MLSLRNLLDCEPVKRAVDAIVSIAMAAERLAAAAESIAESACNMANAMDKVTNEGKALDIYITGQSRTLDVRNASQL